jgi:quercetin dioxygenase-like cupin family protein
MDTTPNPILETKTRCLACDVQTFITHHRKVPELQVGGLSAGEAAEHLVHRLTAALDSAHDDRERGQIEAALTDARAFLNRKGQEKACGEAAPASAPQSQSPPVSVIDIAPSPAASGSPARLLGKGRSLEVRLLTLPEGKEIPTHHAPGEITVHCLSGRIAFTACGAVYELGPGQFLILPAGEPHSLVAHEAASVLVTKQHPEKPVGS